MDEQLPEEIRDMRKSFVRLLTRDIAPEMDGYEKRQEFPRPLLAKIGEAGFLGCIMPEWLGGTDLGFLANVIIAEELARLCPPLSMCANLQAMSCPYTIYIGGNNEQRRRYIPDNIAGKAIGLWSLTEPGGASDSLGNMKTMARRDGDVYRLTGQKMFATMANETDAGVLFAKTDPSRGARGVSAFIVEPKKYPQGWEARPIDFVGLSKSIRSCSVFLDDFVVPVENRLGEEGDGFRIAMHALQAGRISVGARAIGLARACIEQAIEYGKTRIIKGQPLTNYQMVQGAIADSITQVEAARALVYEAASSMDRNLPSNRLASLAKYAAGLALTDAVKRCSEVFGGYSLCEEYPISKMMAYAHLYHIGEGAPNVQRILIAEDALGIKNADRHPTVYRLPSTPPAE
ncbi:MAG: acyl-CoA dehydrogenase family protein [Candidatus Tectomicrobia bacterium]|uniref:Acyl-CoA dehydrogenase family protein n=1 Tax=Tectimicrobiota bacterium TaxID=2528274 RepID=A0A933LQK8_UNCTE|nr:acyl-CoA dehydrogenase family protein [Candidatus Tectomicrobia bacterium]